MKIVPTNQKHVITSLFTKIKMKKKCLKGLPSDYHPTYNDTNNTNAAVAAILPATMPLLFLLEPSSMTLTQKM